MQFQIRLLLKSSHYKGKGNCIAVMEHHVTATECHLPYGITQCYLLPDTSETIDIGNESILTPREFKSNEY